MWSQAWPWHTPAAVRTRGPPRQDRRAARDGSGRAPSEAPRAAELAHGQLAAHRLDGPRVLHRESDPRLGVEGEVRAAPIRQGDRTRLLVLHHRCGTADLLERDAALGRAAKVRSRRGGDRVLRRDPEMAESRLETRPPPP